MHDIKIARPELERERQKLIRSIRRQIKPHLWPSGFRTPIDPRKGLLAGSRPLLLWSPRRNGRTWRLGGFVVDNVEGVTEGGPITDSSMVIVTTGWGDMPYEDLLKFHDWVRFRMLPEIEADAKADARKQSRKVAKAA